MISAFLDIFLLTFIVNFISLIIREIIIPKEEMKKYQEKMKEISEQMKNISSPEEKTKLLEKNFDILQDYLKKMNVYMLTTLLIYGPIFYIVYTNYKGIIIPLPFNNPFTGVPGLGPIATYIICSFISGFILNKIYDAFGFNIKESINKIIKKENKK